MRLVATEPTPSIKRIQRLLRRPAEDVERVERRLNEALTGQLPRRLSRRKCAWRSIGIWCLIMVSPRRHGTSFLLRQAASWTTKFHAYASACIVEYGQRYTLALTWVRRHETTVVALGRLCLLVFREIWP